MTAAGTAIGNNDMIDNEGRILELEKEHHQHAIKLVKLEGDQNHHEDICTVRYNNINNDLKSIIKAVEKNNLPKLVLLFGCIMGVVAAVFKIAG